MEYMLIDFGEGETPMLDSDEVVKRLDEAAKELRELSTVALHISESGGRFISMAADLAVQGVRQLQEIQHYRSGRK